MTMLENKRYSSSLLQEQLFFPTLSLVVNKKDNVKISLEWQYVMLPWCQIELKVKLSYQNTQQMGRRNEKIRREKDPSLLCEQTHLQCPFCSEL